MKVCKGRDNGTFWKLFIHRYNSWNTDTARLLKEYPSNIYEDFEEDNDSKISAAAAVIRNDTEIDTVTYAWVNDICDDESSALPK